MAGGECYCAEARDPYKCSTDYVFLRESAEWLHHALSEKSVEESVLAQCLSPETQQIRALLAERGAAFTADLQRFSGLTKLQTATALWELATAGLASADGFDQLRAMMDPRRKSVAVAQTAVTSLRKRAAARTTAGRWSLFGGIVDPTHVDDKTVSMSGPPSSAVIEKAKRRDAALEANARILLCRYGVLFRDLLARESNAPKWRDLLPLLRRLEARGEIRGGRFVSGAFGEQFAMPEAVESLRLARRQAEARASEAPITVAAADPLNLVGILVPGERVAAVPGREVQFQNGLLVEDAIAIAQAAATPPLSRRRTRPIAELLRAEASSTRAAQTTEQAGLFS